MTSKQTYTPYVPDELVRVVGIEAALLASRLPVFADEKGAICVSFAFLAELWGVDKRKIRNAAEILQAHDIWHYETHHGRNIATVWEKGANFDTFMTLKRCENCTQKGAKNVPLFHNNKETKKNNKCAYAQENFKVINNSAPTAHVDVNNPTGVRKGKRLTRDQYYEIFGDDVARPGWKWYKPQGYERFIYQKL